MTHCYQVITQLTSDFPIERLCKTLGVSRSAYYAYQAGQSHQLTEEKEKLRQAMLDSFGDHRRRYGSRRLLTELQEQGFEVGRHQLRRLMQAEGLRAIQPRSFIPRTTDSRYNGPFSPNLLVDMDFPTAPGRVLVGDITYVPLAGSAWGYLAAWMDLYSRRIKGWTLADNMGEELVHSALRKAI
ncbi:IS3 family transposase, partial [Spirosoma terrae]